MLYEKIGRRIRKLRLMRELTQEQLSRKAGISLSFLGHIERGTRKLSVETLYSFSIALNCSADELMDTGMHSAGKLTPKDLLIQAMVLLALVNKNWTHGHEKLDTKVECLKTPSLTEP